MKYRLFCFALAAATFVATGQGSAQEEFQFQIFDRYLRPLIPQIGMPGLAAVILQGGRVAWKGEYGYADTEKKIPLTIDTPMPVGGITQAVTGVLVGVCIDRYGLEIDQDIRNIVPTFPVAETRLRPFRVQHSPLLGAH
jgi:CubicO group peptidase (beta-lactamase class C family)